MCRGCFRRSRTYRLPDPVRAEARVVRHVPSVEAGEGPVAVVHRRLGLPGEHVDVHDPVREAPVVGPGRLGRDARERHARSELVVPAAAAPHTSRAHTSRAHRQNVEGVLPLHDGGAPDRLVGGGYVLLLVDGPLQQQVSRRADGGGGTAGRHDQVPVVVVLDGLLVVVQDDHHGVPRPPDGVLVGRGDHLDAGRVHGGRRDLVGPRPSAGGGVVQDREGRRLGPVHRPRRLGRVRGRRPGRPQRRARHPQKAPDGELGVAPEVKPDRPPHGGERPGRWS